MIDLKTCKFVVWGFKNSYCSHSHIHEAFYRTLVGMGRDAKWLDHHDDVSGIDFSNTFFISEHAAVRVMPLRHDCFYLIHGANNDDNCKSRLEGYDWLGWNVYLDCPPGTDSQQNRDTWNYSPTGGPTIWLDEEVPFWPDCRRLDFRWATDMLPEEIERNKPDHILGRDSRVINWVGTTWFVNDKELAAFGKACQENGIEFKPVGAGQRGVVSIEENIRLIRSSFMAPAISGSHHNVEGYAPCRVFKNISYAQPGITNNPFVQRLFKNKLIFEPDPYELFYVAKERLESFTVEELHSQMDFVSKNHTYVNRLNAAFRAAELIMKG